MANPTSPIYPRSQGRRSTFNRRWIKSGYKGKERRGRKDRQEKRPTTSLPVPDDFDAVPRTGLEKLLISNAIQLEALIRILLEKAYVTEDELVEMMNKIQVEYQGNK